MLFRSTRGDVGHSQRSRCLPGFAARGLSVVSGLVGPGAHSVLGYRGGCGCFAESHPRRPHGRVSPRVGIRRRRCPDRALPASGAAGLLFASGCAHTGRQRPQHSTTNRLHQSVRPGARLGVGPAVSAPHASPRRGGGAGRGSRRGRCSFRRPGPRPVAGGLRLGGGGVRPGRSAVRSTSGVLDGAGPRRGGGESVSGGSLSVSCVASDGVSCRASCLGRSPARSPRAGSGPVRGLRAGEPTNVPIPGVWVFALGVDCVVCPCPVGVVVRRAVLVPAWSGSAPRPAAPGSAPRPAARPPAPRPGPVGPGPGAGPGVPGPARWGGCGSFGE